MFIYLYIDTSIYRYIYMYIYLCLYIHVCISIYLYICVYICTYINGYYFEPIYDTTTYMLSLDTSHANVLYNLGHNTVYSNLNRT